MKKNRRIAFSANIDLGYLELNRPGKDALLVDAIREQANRRKHRRYGYRRITEILCVLGWLVNPKRVYRLWCQHDWRVPQKRSDPGRVCGAVSKRRLY